VYRPVDKFGHTHRQGHLTGDFNRRIVFNRRLTNDPAIGRHLDTQNLTGERCFFRVGGNL
jgi:hypothetical protein